MAIVNDLDYSVPSLPAAAYFTICLMQKKLWRWRFVQLCCGDLSSG